MKNLLFIFLSFIVLTGCYYDNEEELYPNPTECDTTNVTYSATILPIIRDNCFVCHNANPPQGNIFLGDYASISAAAQIPEGQSGSLYGAITHNPDNFPMPKSGTPLSECTISKIKAWINAGTPNN